jgi:protein-tyrosine phosphatase
MRYNRVIFVCNGNTCRSPIAATIMRDMCRDTDVTVMSRGMVVLFPEPYNPKAVAVCASHGLLMPNNSATQLDGGDFSNDTLILTMSEAQKNKIYAEYENSINVYTLQEYAGEDESAKVDDPYGKGIEEYKQCFDKLHRLVGKAAARLLEGFANGGNDENSNRM